MDSKLGQLLLQFAGVAEPIPYPDVGPDVPVVKEPTEEEGDNEEEEGEFEEEEGAEQPITLTDN